MRFMILMIPGEKSGAEAGVMPDEESLAAMMKYNEDLVKAGIMLGGEGLHPTSKGARIQFANGKKKIIDGPFTEAREIVGGFWMWQVKSKEEAIEWASRCPGADGNIIEIRQVFESADFGPEIEAQETALKAEMDANAGRAS
jgi:hypothetical protein